MISEVDLRAFYINFDLALYTKQFGGESWGMHAPSCLIIPRPGRHGEVKEIAVFPMPTGAFIPECRGAIGEC